MYKFIESNDQLNDCFIRNPHDDNPPQTNNMESPTGVDGMINKFRHALALRKPESTVHDQPSDRPGSEVPSPEITDMDSRKNTTWDFIITGCTMLCGAVLLAEAPLIGVGLLAAGCFLTYQTFINHHGDLLHDHVDDIITAAAISSLPVSLSERSLIGLIIGATTIVTTQCGGFMNLMASIKQHWLIIALIIISVLLVLRSSRDRHRNNPFMRTNPRAPRSERSHRMSADNHVNSLNDRYYLTRKRIYTLI